MQTNTPLAQFIQFVNGALKNYHSVLALARSPLADSELVHPLLVLDDVSPTADERGHALRLVLQWAVTRLAPASITYPLGEERPYDDPTWRDPHWWRYNILRHRYLEPLHPDEFIDGGRFTETLLALTGITSADTFFDERNRAIREVAQRLQEQLRNGQANDELQALALEEVLRPLQRNPEREALLGIAATFDDVFPRRLLLRMARAERLEATERLLDELMAGRYLLVGDGGVNLWLSPVLQQYVYGRQPAAKVRARHLTAAEYYQLQEEPLRAAEHLQQAENWPAAATILLTAAEELVNDLQTDELLTALTRFKAEQLEASIWCELQLICCDLYRRHGQQDAALAACRQALRATTERAQLGQLYWRMGKLYEKRNQRQALGYYERAMSNFSPTDPTVAELRKDRAWLYLLRHEWAAAHEDLQQALALLDKESVEEEIHQATTELHANVLDALAHLHLEQTQFEQAIAYAQRALHLREEVGDLLQVAKSFNNLGNFYSRMGDINEAVAAHDEAIQLYQKLNNSELEAEAWLNRGVVYHTAGRQREAIENYRSSLMLSQRLGLLWAEVTAHANLTEAHAEIEERAAASRHLHYGYDLSTQADFTEELAYFADLAERFSLPLEGITAQRTDDTTGHGLSAAGPPEPVLAPRAMLSLDEREILALAENEGRITPKAIMATQHVSKATATRRLAALARTGLLEKRGKGRGTCYVPTTQIAEQNRVASASASAPIGTANRSHQSPTQPTCDIGLLQELLSAETISLKQIYGVRAVAFMPKSSTQSQTVQLAVRFSAVPTLAAYFQLERTISRHLNRPIDLIPADQLSHYIGHEASATLEWVTI